MAAAGRGRGDARRCGELHDVIEIKVAFGQVGEEREPLIEIAMLARLHESEMALGEGERLVARDRAEDRNSQSHGRTGHESPMPLAADAVEHDAADPDLRIVHGETAHQRRRRLRLPRDIDHEQHRQAEAGGEVCGRSAPPWRRASMPSNSPIAPSMTSISAPPAASPMSASSSAGFIAQLSRLRLGAAGRRRMEGGIDIVGAGLGGMHRNPAPSERREQG